jgi:hypothetical protein
MEKEPLSAREQALLAEARREAAARKVAPTAAPASPTEGARPAPQPKPAPTPAERLAQLMADERAETVQRKKKMRRYGLAISGAILALFALWLARAFRPRR